MLERGIAKNPGTDLDDMLSTTCVGVDLVEGRSWCAPGARCWSLLDALLDLANLRVGSRGAVVSSLGSANGLICSGDCNSASSTIPMGFALVRWLETGPCSRFLRRCSVVGSTCSCLFFLLLPLRTHRRSSAMAALWLRPTLMLYERSLAWHANLMDTFVLVMVLPYQLTLPPELVLATT